MNAPMVLVVDDERDLVELITFNLKRQDYAVLACYDGNTALELARREKPDIVILDLMLPQRSGRDVAALLRADASTRAIPIIMLTAMTGEHDVVAGLQMGADDYVTKPFSMEVLIARVAAVLRRGRPSEQDKSVIRAGAVTIDRARHVVLVDGQPVAMTLTEFRLLEALVAAKARVLSRDQLMAKVMGPDIAVTDRTIDVHITSLRRKLGASRDLVETVRGVGYRFADVWQGEPVSC
jgi:DNA-binding response OmpR family regulator